MRHAKLTLESWIRNLRLSRADLLFCAALVSVSAGFGTMIKRDIIALRSQNAKELSISWNRSKPEIIAPGKYQMIFNLTNNTDQTIRVVGAGTGCL